MKLVKYEWSVDYRHIAICIEERGHGWAITKLGYCFNKNKEWEYEPAPYGRDQSFYDRCRYRSFSEAKAFIEEAFKEGTDI